MTSTPTGPYRLAGAVFALALALRGLAFVFVVPQLDPAVNLDDYRGLARSLNTGQGFVVSLPDGRTLPSAERTPVYPVFLAAWMRVGGDRLSLFLAAQCLLGALTCALTVGLANRWLPWPAAAMAGLLVAIDPNSVLRCLDLRTETLFTFLLVGGTLMLAWRGATTWGALAAGVCWSLAALARPIALLLPVALLIVWIAQRRRPAAYAWFLVGFLPLVALWTERNHRLTGTWFFCSISTGQTTFYRAAGVEAARTHHDLPVVQHELAERLGQVAYVDDADRFGERLRAVRQAGRAIFCAAPGLTLQQEIIGWGRLLFGPGSRSLENSRRAPVRPRTIVAASYVVALGVLVAAAFRGLVRLGRRGLLLGVLAAYFIVLAGGAAANSRFRTPILPLLAVLAVAGVVQPGPDTTRTE